MFSLHHHLITCLIVLIPFTSVCSVLTYRLDSKTANLNSLVPTSETQNQTERLTRGRGTPAETPLRSSTPSRCDLVPLQSRSTRGSGCPVLWWRPDARSCTESRHSYTWRLNQVLGSEIKVSLRELLTEFPHMRSRPHSTPWLSDHERRCTDRGFPSWTRDPEKEKAFDITHKRTTSLHKPLSR